MISQKNPTRRNSPAALIMDGDLLKNQKSEAFRKITMYGLHCEGGPIGLLWRKRSQICCMGPRR